MILKINKFVKAVKSVNQEKLLENFENIINSTGKVWWNCLLIVEDQIIILVQLFIDIKLEKYFLVI